MNAMKRPMPRIFVIAACVCCFVVPSSHAEVIGLEGTVKAVDVDARTVTIERKTPSGTKTLTLEVAKKAGNVADLKPGSPISFSYDPDLEIVTTIGSHDNGKSVPAEEAVSTSGEEPSAALAAMQGEWRNTVTEVKGIRSSKATIEYEQRTVLITGSTFRMERLKEDGQWGFTKGILSLNPKQTHFTLDVNGTPGMIFHGIYEVDGRNLRLCYRMYEKGRTPNKRPMTFDTNTDHPPIFYFEYEKVPE
jgi:uncharacterized protein (TIGR03067 family)